ncbi:MAG: hypothetical protein ACRENE_25395 [Polyangiaceae bacterium]
MAPVTPKPPARASRLARWRARWAEWQIRSSRAFLAGLVVACTVEVLVDWSSTLREINTLRDTIRLKGESYVAILGKASDDELAARDRVGLDRLTHGIFDDEDTIYVRFTDAAGAVVWDKLKAGFDAAFRQRGSAQPFLAEYAALMDRDSKRALRDPQLLQSHVANSRYKDFAQAWTDATARAFAAFVPPEPPPAHATTVVYQDRLHDDKHQKDDRVSYALGTVVGEDGKDIGTVLVAFDMQRTEDAVRFKYVKFGGICSFFVILILLQNSVSRRTKLRLLDLGAKNSAAKTALREAMPEGEVRSGTTVACGAVDQASASLDGMLWTAADEGDSLLVLVVDPDGDGVDAAAVALYAARTFQRRRAEGGRPSLDDELRALGEGVSGIPLTRPLRVLLLRVDSRTGAFDALCGGIVPMRVLGRDGGAALPMESVELEAPAGILAPLQRASGVLEASRPLLAVCVDPAKVDASYVCESVARYLQREGGAGGLAMALGDAATWARGRTAAKSEIAVVAISR